MLKKIFFILTLILFINTVFSITNINNCTSTQPLNTQGETYIVNQNLTTNTTCLTFLADNIILDCNGYTLTGNGGNLKYGIFINGRKNNIIKNCNINTFHHGIYLASTLTYNNTITNINLSNNNISGISLNDALGNTFTNIKTYQNKIQGIYLNSYNNKFINVNSSNNLNRGFYLENAYNNTFTNVIAEKNNNIGFLILRNSNNNIITNSKISDTNNNIYFQEVSGQNPINNIISNSYLGLSTRINSNNISNINYFNDSSYGNYYSSFNNSLPYCFSNSLQFCDYKPLISWPNGAIYTPAISNSSNSKANIFPNQKYSSTILSLSLIIGYLIIS